MGRTVKLVGKPDAGNPPVRFDERGRETERAPGSTATAPVLDSTYCWWGFSEKFPDAEAYNADHANDGLQKTMTYTSQSNPKNKLTLTEKSSKKISHRHHLVCGRDEDNSTERKVFRVERSNVPTVDVTLQCREYLLTSRGGRPCISN